MPALVNHRRELFAQLLFQGFTAVDAYQQAGFKRHSGNASILARHPEIEDRVEQLRAEAEAALVPVGTSAIAAKANVTAESLIAEAEAVRAGAMKGHQFAAANNAIKTKGVLGGVWIERAEVGQPGEFEALTDAELDRFIADEFNALFGPRLGIIDGSALDGAALKDSDD